VRATLGGQRWRIALEEGGRNNRQFLYRPDALHITHIYLIAHHPWNVEVDTQWSCWRKFPFTNVPSPCPDKSQGIMSNYLTWSKQPDDLEFFTDVDAKNEEEYPRFARGLTSRTQQFPTAPGEASRPSSVLTTRFPQNSAPTTPRRCLFIGLRSGTI